MSSASLQAFDQCIGLRGQRRRAHRAQATGLAMQVQRSGRAVSGLQRALHSGQIAFTGLQQAVAQLLGHRA